MVFQMLAVLAEFERNQISERTTAAMAHMRGQGRFLGQVPFGYDLAPDGDTLVVNATETDTIRRIVELRRKVTAFERSQHCWKRRPSHEKRKPPLDAHCGQEHPEACTERLTTA